MRRTPVTCCLLLLVLSLGLGLAASTDGGASPVQGTSFIVHATGTLHQGHTVTLSCYLDVPSSASIPRPSSYVWVKDGKVIPGQTEVTLNLERLTKQDEGDYQCGAPDSDIPKGKYQLKVFIPGTDILPKPHIFQSGLPVCGSEFALDCVILEGYTANANTRYTWYKDSSEVKGESGQVLRFTNVTEVDEGEYVCTAREGPVETTSPPSSAYYLKPLVFPNVHIEPASNNSVVKGVLRENLTLTCEVTRAFPPVPVNGYSWSFLPSNQGQKQLLAEKSSSLTLAPLTRQHSGQYHCQARNDQDLRGLRLNGSASVTVDVVYLENISMTHDLEVSEGEPLTLTCAVDSHPAAHLTWSVNGKDVRHVTDNLDHYFIQQTPCSDTVNYTCRANNPDMPGQEKATTTHVKVKCTRDPRHQTPQNGDIYTEDSAPLDFLLPKQTAMVVVHPSGQTIITFYQNCSYVISEAFRSRCVNPYCDLDGQHVSFTLTQLTEKDEGNYICLEEGKENKTVPNCIRRLFIKKQSTDGMLPEVKVLLMTTVVMTVMLVIAVVMLIFIRRRTFTKLFIYQRSDSTPESTPMTSCITPSTETHINEESHTFERLYKKGKVYVFPELVSPEHRAKAVSEEGTSESAPLLSHTDDPAVDEAPYVVKDLLRYTLQRSTGENDLPSFLLHNTRLSRKENVILIFSRKLGVAVMVVRSDNDLKHVDSLEKAVTHLLEAKGEVSEKVSGLVKSKAVTAAIAFPNLPDTKVTDLRDCIKILRSHPEVEALIGQDKATLREWAERLSSRPDSEVWDLRTSEVDNPDTAFKMAASKFLTLAGTYHPGESPQLRTAAELWLLTSDQMQVRDSTARLLHVWGSPGSGKTALLIHRARQWLEDRKAVVLAVGREVYDVLLAHVVKEVLRQQNKETRIKFRVCRMHSELELTVKELRGQYPETEICLVIDTLRDPLLFQNMIKAVKSQQVSAVWSVCRDSLQTIDPALAKETQSLGWESLKLPDSIRCTKDTVDLLNQLRKKSIYFITACSIPRTRVIPTRRVVDHCRHPNYMSTMSNCGPCKRELSTALSLPDRIPHWREWIALFTGNPNEHIDIKPVCKILMNHGVPVSPDSYYEIVASHGSHPDSSDTDVARWLERVVAGNDEGGNPTVHLVRVRDLAGMEKEGVLLVHWDERDIDPNCQSVGDRIARLEEHRHLWFLAVSRCKSQVILLLLTPSPARSLLNLPEAVMPVT